jgi:hypothetical protein
LLIQGIASFDSGSPTDSSMTTISDVDQNLLLSPEKVA